MPRMTGKKNNETEADFIPVRVTGPYHETSKDARYQWKIRVIDSHGKIHWKTFKTEAAAEDKMALISDEILSREVADRERVSNEIGDFDGSLNWFMGILAAKTRLCAVRGNSDDRASLKAIASACLAAKNLFDTTDLENKLAQIEEIQKQIDVGRKHGVGSSGESKPSSSPLHSNQPIH